MQTGFRNLSGLPARVVVVFLLLWGDIPGAGEEGPRKPQANQQGKSTLDQETKLLEEEIRTFVRQRDADPVRNRRFREEVSARIGKLSPLPDTLAGILGPDKRLKVSRQLLYQRYLEVWRVEWPVRLRVVYDFHLGRDPVLREVRPDTD